MKHLSIITELRKVQCNIFHYNVGMAQDQLDKLILRLFQEEMDDYTLTRDDLETHYQVRRDYDRCSVD